MDRIFRQKINMERKHLCNTIGQMSLPDIYKTFHPTETEYIFTSSEHTTVYRKDHIRSQNKSFFLIFID